MRFLIKLIMMRLFGQAFSKTIDRLVLTPHQYWIAAGNGMERPYTGEYWFVM
jgi:peptide-methionine (R)-S-oxide reductase